MTRKSINTFFVALLVAFITIFSPLTQETAPAANRSSTNQPAANQSTASSFLSFVLLSSYNETLNIGDSVKLYAFTSNFKAPSYKSSNSAVASVSSDGIIKAKHAGTCIITVSITGAYAECKVKVKETQIYLNHTKATMEIDKILQLSARSSNGHSISFKSSKPSVASVSSNGLVISKKAGTSIISVSCDDTTVKCEITVKKPTIKLSKNSISLYRTGKYHLTASVSSGKTPSFKSNKSSIAQVDSDGNITAIKHGIALITVSVDGTSKTCTVTVCQPTITLSSYNLTLKEGQSATLTARVSSGVSPVWSSSNNRVVTVDSYGRVTALKKGTAYIYAREDGVKATCAVTVK